MTGADAMHLAVCEGHGAPDAVPLDFEGMPVRVVTLDGAPWFAAPDVCRVLKMADVTSALRVLDEDEKGPLIVRTPGGQQVVNGISEPGLYRLMGRSRRPEARRFDRWVRHEVLPAIRRDGGYLAAGLHETPEALALRALTVLRATVERQKLQLAQAAPKAEALDRLSAAKGSLTITAAAKVLRVQPKRLFAYLERHGWIYRRSSASDYLGHGTRVAAGLLEHRATALPRPDGSERVAVRVLVTPKGLARLAAIGAIGGDQHDQ